MFLLSGAKIKCPLFVLERVHIVEVLFKRKYLRTLVGHRKLYALERCPYREGFHCIKKINLWTLHTE